MPWISSRSTGLNFGDDTEVGTMRIDVVLDSRLDPRRLSELGQLAEQCGIGTVWTASYLNSRDPFTNLAELARSSCRIRLGPIAVNPFEQHPLRIASALLTLNEICEGRANIVVGGGGEVIQALGIRPDRRVRAVRECVQIVRAAAAGGPVSFNGDLYQVNNYRPDWAVSPAPRIYVAANKPQMLRMATDVADGIMLSDLPPVLCNRIIADVRARRATVGHGGDSFEISNFKAWHIYEDRDEAMREARQWLAYRGLFRRWVITTFLSDSEYDLIEAQKSNLYAAAERGAHTITGIPERVLDALVDNLTLAGHVSELDGKIAHLAELKAAGVDAVVLELRQHVEDSIRMIGERVVPALR